MMYAFKFKLNEMHHVRQSLAASVQQLVVHPAAYLAAKVISSTLLFTSTVALERMLISQLRSTLLLVCKVKQTMATQHYSSVAKV